MLFGITVVWLFLFTGAVWPTKFLAIAESYTEREPTQFRKLSWKPDHFVRFVIHLICDQCVISRWKEKKEDGP